MYLVYAAWYLRPFCLNSRNKLSSCRPVSSARCHTSAAAAAAAFHNKIVLAQLGASFHACTCCIWNTFACVRDGGIICAYVCAACTIHKTRIGGTTTAITTIISWCVRGKVIVIMLVAATVAATYTCFIYLRRFFAHIWTTPIRTVLCVYKSSALFNDDVMNARAKENRRRLMTTKTRHACGKLRHGRLNTNNIFHLKFICSELCDEWRQRTIHNKREFKYQINVWGNMRSRLNVSLPSETGERLIFIYEWMQAILCTCAQLEGVCR